MNLFLNSVYPQSFNMPNSLPGQVTLGREIKFDKQISAQRIASKELS